MRYVLDFGTINAGGSPTFSTYKNADTLANLAQPTISEVGDGLYYFDVDWATVSATTITFKAILAGSEIASSITASGTSTSPAVSVAAAVSSTNGFTTAGPLIARALVRSGILNLSQTQISAYDPFASTSATVNLMVELMNELGQDLASKLKASMERTATITTAASATSYALPSDYLETIPQTGWDRSTDWPLIGPVSAAREQRLIATNTSAVVGVEFRIQGNLITFPIAPSDGLTLAFKYVSRYWVQTSGASSPDADHITGRTDYVLFDPLLIVRGLRWRFAMDKGLPEAGIALAEYEERLEWAKGAVASAPVLSLGGRSGHRWIDGCNAPDTGYGA